MSIPSVTKQAKRERYSSMGARVGPPVICALLTATLDNPRILSLAAGFTATSTLPLDRIDRTVAQLGSREGPPEHLQYGTTQGRRRLRELLSARTAHQDECHPGVIIPARTMIGNGSQQLLYLAIQVLCDPGDIVLVERPTYFVFLEMLRGLGVRAVSLPTDDDGAFDFDGIHQLLERLKQKGEIHRVKALYSMTYFANPSGISRTKDEKKSLASVLEKADLVVPVIEDAAYRELWFRETWPAKSLLAFDEWEAFPRVYLATLTKPFATGLKIGYAHGSDADLLDRMLWVKGHQDFGSSNFTQAILEEVLDAGALDPHLRALRPVYEAKMRALSDALDRCGLRAMGWHWSDPSGGLYLWLRAPEGIDTRVEGAFWKACLEEDVLYVPGDLCLAERDDHQWVRASFGVLEPDELAEAATRFCRAASRVAPAVVR